MPSLVRSPIFHRRPGQAGFTTTELMVVVALVGILAAISSPYLAKDRKAGAGSAFAAELTREFQRVRMAALSERLPVRAFIFQDRIELRSWIAGARPGDPPRAPTTSDPVLRQIPAPGAVTIYAVLTTAAPAPSTPVLTTSSAVLIDFNSQGQMQFQGQAPMSPAFVFIRNADVRSNHPEAYLRVDIRSLTGYVAFRQGWN